MYLIAWAAKNLLRNPLRTARNLGFIALLLTFSLAGVAFLGGTNVEMKRALKATHGDLTISAREAEGLTAFQPQGCEECHGRGYQGRVGIFELLFFVRHSQSWQSNIELFGIAVHARSVWPWLASAAMAVCGSALCRFTYPRTAQAWRTTNTAIAER